MLGGGLIGFLLLMLAFAAAVTIFIFVFVPLMRGVGSGITWVFRAVGWVIAHLVEYVAGTIGDVVRAVGAIFALAVFTVLALFNVVLGRWSAVAHFGDALTAESRVLSWCAYRALLRRPLKLFWLHGLLEGVEMRVPEAIAAAPAADRPSRRTGQFDGYAIVGSLPAGGSGAKLHIAEPDESVRRRYATMPERVVIKSFALAEGSSLPQIVRESRALECAKKLGLVYEHGMESSRFWYVMPYHPGDNLGVVTRQLHGETDGTGLDARRIAVVLGFADDLLGTLGSYHREGLWHKDVKPDNLIVHGGHAHLVDLGLVTPLRSAMTLTTHGTEYFRDPELVRQALRGVKVHEVDGTRFDVYAAGAVLYFMIENEFPAHGALSRFSKRSPEAIKWVVRRAMADYHHRYSSARAMQADLRAIMTASDPFAVRAADLPSVREGASANDHAFGDETQEAAFVPPVPPEPPVAPRPAAAFPFGGEKDRRSGSASEQATADGRRAAPTIAVTNWWTGAYAGPAIARGTQQPMPAVRRTAAQQVAAARQRANTVRRRHSRVVAPAERMPLVDVVLLTLVISGAVIYFAMGTARVVPGVLASGGSKIEAPVEAMASGTAIETTDRTSYEGLGSFVFVVDHAGATDPSVAARIAEIRAEYEARGATFREDPDLAGRAHAIIASGASGVRAEGRIENLLLAHDLGGVVHVHSIVPGGTRPETVAHRVYTRAAGPTSAAQRFASIRRAA